MIKRLHVSIVLVLLLLFTAMPSAAQDAYEPIFEPTECAIPVPMGAAGMDCGFLIVPEDRNGDPNDTIRIAVAIYHARSDNPAPDPVFFLHGGPAIGMLESMSALYRFSFIRLNADRDLVVFDQRGVGLSEPALRCTEFGELPMDETDLTIEEGTSFMLETLSTCRERLEADFGVNTAAYTSAASASDIADLAEALGYDTINLYGISYGSQLAQFVMRDYPDLVRAAALDGILPLEINLLNEAARNTALALDELFSDCATSPACGTSYPDLETTFYDTIAALNENPQPITITFAGEDVDVQFGMNEFLSGITLMLRSPILIPEIPQMIDRVANGQRSAIQTLAAMLSQESEGIITGSDDTYFSIICHEEVFATTAEQLDADLNAVPELAPFNESDFWQVEDIFDICATWGAAPFDPAAAEPVTSDIPTLLLGGQYDPTTPPEWNALVAQHLTNFYSYEIPGAGHLPTLFGGCAMEIATDFLNDPTTEPDTSCIERLGVTFTVAR